MEKHMTNIKIVCLNPDEGRLVETRSSDADKLIVRVVCDRIVLCGDDGLCRVYALAVPHESRTLSTAIVFLCADDGSLLDQVCDAAIVEEVYRLVLERCA